MKVNLIVAVSKNGVIGKDNKLLWSLPTDLKNFRTLTSGNTVIMGRKTFDSIGKSLPNRLNVVISRTNPVIKDCIVVDNIISAIKKSDKGEIFIIGGEEIYKLFLQKDLVDRIYLTLVDADVDGDAHFEFDESKWKVTFKQDFEKDSKNEYNYSFITYER